MASVHVLGSLNVDHPVRVARHPDIGETVLGEALAPTPGGKGLNQAVAAALACGPNGVAVYLHGTVGADDEGRWLREFAQEQGVLVDRVQVDPDARTGSAWITVAADGANTVIVDPGANRVAAFDAAVVLSPDDVVVAQLEVPEAAVADLFRSAGAAGARSIFNPSPVGAGRDLAPEASIVVLNEHELSELSGASLSAHPGREAVEQMAATVRQSDQTVVVTLGAAGAMAVWPGGTEVVPGLTVHAVDTTGAGDCFLGVLAASLAGGLAFPDALRRANRAAARSVTRTGAAEAMPSAAEIGP